ncbi:MAG: regulatory signaling modulator protein AmpE, partial [Halioglobus sp.]
MKFLAVVIALVMFRAGTAVHAVQQDGWFERWQRRVAGWQLVPWMGLGVVIAVPVLIAIGVLDTLDDILFGLPWIFAAVLLVLYAFGRGDLEQLQARYRMQSQSGDFEAAMLGFLPEPDANNPPMSARDVHRAVQQVLFYEAFQRWFAVLFYFVIAGPAAALAYRLVQLSRGSFEAALVERVLFLLDWVPAR